MALRKTKQVFAGRFASNALAFVANLLVELLGVSVVVCVAS